ncbi:autotransporter outer membrane beta-barrel domain-containing protein [Christiangramia forsetii]|uniref:Secreted protein n=2 Tax=Christiangramia forsetii TaxID=411153 RepID=A0M6U8_CHRFK|nr:autotransporter outer membrane beta-barrel domain-containing protein [Christiangramia forsetii]GGG29483.1 hypothetical protein GCM10011532_11180 [Christiangramia forsetii]CAL68343.1 secreted protein [Christiangramia forsetii KT0803]
MRKILFVLPIILFQFGFLQSQEKFNEVKFNIANTIAIASVELGYERFIDDHQSLEGVLLINDRINYHSEKGSREFSTQSYKLGYNYYFGEDSPASGLYANPFLKYRTGEFSEDAPDALEPEFSGDIITDMNTFMIGLGGGYKWNFNNTFVLGPFINIARNFSEEVKDRFSAIEFNAGFNVGYRF